MILLGRSQIKFVHGSSGIDDAPKVSGKSNRKLQVRGVSPRSLGTSQKEPGVATTPENARARDEVRQLIDDQMRAIRAKDLDRLMRHYAADVAVFNLRPPFQITGAEAWRRVWEAGLSHFPDSFQTELRDLSVTASGDLAVAHWLWRFAGMDKDHPAVQTWMRHTAGYRRTRGGWQIVHEHISVPFNPETGRAAFARDP
jgi:ketosteroid isomerase-like protein